VTQLPNTSEQEQVRTEKLAALRALGIDPWGQRFDGHMPIAEVVKLPADLPEGQRPRVRIAGRIVSRREAGKKLLFVDLKDYSGEPTLREVKSNRREQTEEDQNQITHLPDLTSRVQVMVNQSLVSPESWQLTGHLDLGDLIGVDGTFGKSRTGELTVFAEKLTFLTKSLMPHPEKVHGIQDIEFRLRHRYLDLIYNPETLDRTRKRIQLLRTIRDHLNAQGYWEVETPTLHAIAGGAAARPFITHHNALDIQLYLRIALELHLKRLLIGGIEKVYEIGRVFRNEGIDARHNPEFTMLELYQAYGNYETMMELTEGLIVACVRALGESLQRPYGEATVDYTPPFQRRKYGDLFREHVGCDMFDRPAVQAAATRECIPLQLGVGDAAVAKEHWVLVQELFDRCVEDKLIGPVFVCDYPAVLCPLTKRQAGNPEIAERFELFVLGMELANAYTELNDPITQEETFRRQLAGMSEEDSMAKMDHEFIEAQRHGMPPAGGLGIGIDRLCMLLTNTQTIRDVILFPLLRPEPRGE
jgi:lysyl-tRNA synthetase class 2